MKTTTGRYRFRNEGGLLVLQIEFSEYKQDAEFGVMSGSEVETWEDARTEDLLDVEFCKRPIFPSISNSLTVPATVQGKRRD